jgi:hypothetical protein
MTTDCYRRTLRQTFAAYRRDAFAGDPPVSLTVDINILCHLISVKAESPTIVARVTQWS